MKNIMTILATTAAMALAANAYAAGDAKTETKVEYKKDGGYESKTTASSDTDATKKTSETKVDVDVNSKGLITKTVESETTTDPKGLMNKEKDTLKSEVKEKSDGYEKSTSAATKDADGTSVKTKTSVDVETDASGNVVETAKVKKVVDPKGLMNKETTTETVKTVNGTVVEHEKK